MLICRPSGADSIVVSAWPIRGTNEHIQIPTFEKWICIILTSGHNFYSAALGYNTESGGVDERPITNAI